MAPHVQVSISEDRSSETVEVPLLPIALYQDILSVCLLLQEDSTTLPPILCINESFVVVKFYIVARFAVMPSFFVHEIWQCIPQLMPCFTKMLKDLYLVKAWMG